MTEVRGRISAKALECEEEWKLYNLEGRLGSDAEHCPSNLTWSTCSSGVGIRAGMVCVVGHGETRVRS